jgi:hypothetical protein
MSIGTKMKLIALALSVALTGCSTQRILCTGTGTCDVGVATYTPTARVNTLPSQVLLPTGTYLIVPNASTGGIQAVIQTSRTK